MGLFGGSKHKAPKGYKSGKTFSNLNIGDTLYYTVLGTIKYFKIKRIQKYIAYTIFYDKEGGYYDICCDKLDKSIEFDSVDELRRGEITNIASTTLDELQAKFPQTLDWEVSEE